MEPNSVVLVVLLVLMSGGLVFTAIRFRPLAVRIAAGVFAVALAALSGIAMVNDYYGYYQTWSQLRGDFFGGYSSFADQSVGRRTAETAGHGRMESVALPGAASGINRRGYVYLPPQYFQPRYAHTRFPVVELLHGSPGSPTNWVVQINLAGIMDKLISENLAGPMVVVMPAINAGNRFEECVDAPGARDDTYISQDVPTDVRAHFRVAQNGAEWGIAGYSSGGYCAANLSLRHRADYGAAAVMDGYFRPTDGPAAGALHANPAAEAQNDPLATAEHLARGTDPMPALWLSAATGTSKYAKGAQAFVKALHGVEAVTLVAQPGAGHNFYAWRAVIPRMLAWMWTAVAPPELRVQFPIAGTVDRSVVVPPLKSPPSSVSHRSGSGKRSPAGRATPPVGSAAGSRH